MNTFRVVVMAVALLIIGAVLMDAVAESSRASQAKADAEASRLGQEAHAHYMTCRSYPDLKVCQR